MTIHYIPESLTVGVSFGAVGYNIPFASLAGVIIFVVVKDLIPASQQCGNTDAATMGAMLGFAVMMFLDVALG